MRFLHTSDWHLGRSFGPVSLRSDQAAFCDRVVAVANEEGVDLVVMAVITGNHDRADRVAPYDDLLDLSGIYVRGGYNGVGRVVTHSLA